MADALSLWVKAKIAGKPSIYPRVVPDERASLAEMVPNRTRAFDQILTRRLRQVDQLVMMGAGMDTRAYGALDLNGVRVFELDQATIQRLKRNTLKRADIDARHVTFVEVDFATEDAFDRLTASGYDASKRTLFLWEGVTLYLTKKAVRDTLAQVRGHSAPGSTVVVDIYGERMLAMSRRAGARQALNMTGEGLQFGMSFAADWEAEFVTFAKSVAFTPRETHFLGTQHAQGPFMVVVELET